MTDNVDLRIDARGSFCPGPLMELVKAVKKLETGQIVELLSEDEGSKKDVPAWVEKAGHKLVEVKEYEGYRGFVIEKGERKSRKRRS